MTLWELGAEFDQIAKATKPKVIFAMRDALGIMLEVAQESSSGPYSLEALRRMGHPFARRRAGVKRWNAPMSRHVQASLRPEIINAQTGDFYSAWQTAPIREAGDMIYSGIYNDDRKAHWLEGGTRLMVERPVAQLIYDRAETQVYAALIAALES